MAASGPTSSRRFSIIAGNLDEAGKELTGDNVYTLTFPKDQLPAQYATFFWSVLAVDGHRFRVLPFRFYRPTEGVANGTYYPPPLVRRK